MSEAQALVRALCGRWEPEAVLVCGSFADGTQDAASDFDAVVLTDRPAPVRDTGLLLGRRQDVWFLRPADTGEDWDPAEWPQLYHARAVFDPGGLGEALIRRVRARIDAYPPKSAAANEENLDWLERMVTRARRGDAEGCYRLLWLLAESLEIWCDLRGRWSFGPKKSLARLEAEEPEGFALYAAALRAPSPETAGAWVAYLRASAPAVPPNES